MSIYRDGKLSSDAAKAATAAKESLLGRVRIASPCAVAWDEMHGDDRVRHCFHCEKDVFNVSAMTQSEAEDFVARAAEDAGFVCVRFFRRADGTILTADCPVGTAKKRRRLKLVGAAAGVLTALSSIRAAQDASSAATDAAAAKANMGGLGVAREPASSASSQAVYK